MNREKALMVLVVADVVLAFSVIGAELFFNWMLPGSLREYTDSWWKARSTPWDVGVFAFWSVGVTLTLASWVALLYRWWFARRLYVFAWAAWMLIVLFSGPSVLNPVGAMFNTLETLVAGAILGLVYFSDLSRQFERSPAGVTNGAHASA